MSHGDLPRSIRAFILEHVHSVEQLEILLLLHKHPDWTWTEDSVNTVVQSSRSSVTNRLEDLTLRQLVTRRRHDGRDIFAYNPDSEYNEVVRDIARFYGTHRVTIVELIYSRPIEVIRNFADAFRLRKGDP